jgi:DHA1 family multidrug resistance protein-like MFS transporter
MFQVFSPETRGKPISIYTIGPMAGPVLGSALGYWILFGGWRWLFGTIAIMSAANLMLFITLTEETCAP